MLTGTCFDAKTCCAFESLNLFLEIKHLANETHTRRSIAVYFKAFFIIRDVSFGKIILILDVCRVKWLLKRI